MGMGHGDDRRKESEGFASFFLTVKRRPGLLPPFQSLSKTMPVKRKNHLEIIDMTLDAFLVEVAFDVPAGAEMMNHVPIDAAEFRDESFLRQRVKVDSLFEHQTSPTLVF